MAGDWIKMRNDLPEDPAVIGIAANLSIDEFSVVGRLHKFWAWADRQSRDGHAVGVTKAWIDRYVHCDGFASALEIFGWLTVTDRGISIPNFDSHNGESAKQRCTATKRQQKNRSKASCNDSESELSRSECDKSVTREEKRREEKSSSLRSEEEPRPRAIAPTRPDDVQEQVWADWLQLRRAKKAPVTSTVIESARNESIKAGMSFDSFLRVWCARGSQGLQADWIKPHERNNGPPASKQSALEARNAATVARVLEKMNAPQ